jgi:hypothetical protein
MERIASQSMSPGLIRTNAHPLTFLLQPITQRDHAPYLQAIHRQGRGGMATDLQGKRSMVIHSTVTKPTQIIESPAPRIPCQERFGTSR